MKSHFPCGLESLMNMGIMIGKSVKQIARDG